MPTVLVGYSGAEVFSCVSIGSPILALHGFCFYRPMKPSYVFTLILGVLGAAAGLFVLLVGPGNTFPNWLAVVFFLLMLVSGAQQIRRLHQTRNVAFLLVITGVIFWYCYSNAMAAIFEPSRCLDWTTCFLPEEIVITFLYVCSFIGVFSIAYGIFRYHITDGGYNSTNTQRGSEKRDTVWLDVIGFVAIAIGLLPILASGLSFNELLAYAFLGRAVEKVWLPTSNLGNEGSALLWGARLMLISGLTLTFSRLLTSPRSLAKNVLPFIAWFIPFLFQAFDTGTRYITLSILLPGLILKYLQLGKGIRITGVVAVFAGLILFSQLQLIYRYEGIRAMDYELPYFQLVTLAGSTDFYHETTNALRLHKELGTATLDNDVMIFATFLVPRSIWPDKPVPEAVQQYTYFRWGQDILQEAGNVFPGLIGQYILSFGASGPILIGLVFGLFAAIIDRRLNANIHFSVTSTLPALCYAVGLFLSFRYFSPGYFVAPLFVHLGVSLAQLKYKRHQFRL